VDRAATGVGTVSEAAERKARNCPQTIFQPIAMANLGAFASSSAEFLKELGRRLSSLCGEGCFLFQRLSVAIRLNSVLLHNGFTDDIPDL